MKRTQNVGILLFADAEILDFAGPYEVYSVASRVAMRDNDSPVKPFEVFTVAKDKSDIRVRHGLVVRPDYDFSNCPSLDILVVPGGVVTTALEDPDTIAWTKSVSASSHLTTSVCTGAFLLAKAGLLDGLTVTTHWEDLQELSEYTNLDVIDGVRFVDEGDFLTSAGVSSGIEMSLNIVGDILGVDAVGRIAHQMEYPFSYTDRQRRPGTNASPKIDWRCQQLASNATFQQS